MSMPPSMRRFITGLTSASLRTRSPIIIVPPSDGRKATQEPSARLGLSATPSTVIWRSVRGRHHLWPPPARMVPGLPRIWSILPQSTSVASALEAATATSSAKWKGRRGMRDLLSMSAGSRGNAIFGRRPTVCFLLPMGTPRIQGVIHDEPVAQQLLVIGVDRRESQRNGVEAGRLRRQIEPAGIRAADYGGEARERRIVQVVLRQKGVETALWPVMAQRYARHVKRQRARGLGHP